MPLSEKEPCLLGHLLGYGFNFFDGSRNLPQERKISRHPIKVVLRRGKVFVGIDEVLVHELEESRSLETVPVGHVPAIVQDTLCGGTVEAAASPRPKQIGFQPFEVNGIAQSFLAFLEPS
jgi:hypothetical protein